MSIKPTAAIHTLGCKLNQAESEKLARELASAGYRLAFGKTADIHIVNTCTVTHAADGKARQTVRMLRRQSPQAYIVVTGCYAERDAAELAACGADWVVGNEGKMSLTAGLASRVKKPLFSGRIGARGIDRVRSFIKIQDGCQNFCSYCIVPYVRSNVVSLPADSVVREIGAKVDAGYMEIVLTGTEIGSYADNQLKLSGLVRRILKETGVKRLHLSSLQPQGIDRALLDLWEDKRLSRHFHIALQSGSDSVLKRMRRKYGRMQFKKTVDEILGIMPEAAVTTDIIVGFPGESSEEHLESYNFCKDMGFAAMHVFSYSARPGTLAAGMPGQISSRLKKERSVQMLEIAAAKADAFAGRFTGQEREVLWENELGRRSSVYAGLTDNYIRVYTRSEVNITNQLLKTKLIGQAWGTQGPVLRASTRGNHGEIWGEVIE